MSIRGLFGRLTSAPPVPAPVGATAVAGEARPLAAPAALLLAVRADRRHQVRDYATLAAAIVGDIREQIASGWMLACWLEEFIDDYLRRAGLDPETVNRAELRVAIRARRDVTYVQKQRIKTDGRFDELRAWVRARYRADHQRRERVLNDKVAVYYVAATETARGRDAPAAVPAPVRDGRATSGTHVGRDPGLHMGRDQGQPIRRAVAPETGLFGERRRAA